MSNDKALAIVPRSIGEVQSLADLISKSGLLPDALRNKAPDIIMSILTGQELGLSPMAAIRGIHIVQGRPTLGADTMMGLCLASGFAEYFSQIEATATSVTFETRRKGSPVPQRCTWTIEDVKRAGLNTKENHRLYPRQMMAARCKAELARAVYPDILAGVYDPDEIQSSGSRSEYQPQPASTSKHDDAVDAELVDTNNSPLSIALNDIAGASTADELRALAKSLSKLSEPGKSEARHAYKARMVEFDPPVNEVAATSHANGTPQVEASP